MNSARLEHGNVLLVEGTGIWITGQSGIGKSELSLALVDRGHRLVADDVAWISRRNGRLEARADPAQFGMIHIRDLGVIDLTRLFGRHAVCPWVVLDVWVDLSCSDQEAGPGNPDQLLSGARRQRGFLNVSLPCITMNANRSRPLALLVECAARQHHQVRDRVAPPRDPGQNALLQGTVCV
jgi:HPr kinase/phosphorylase